MRRTVFAMVALWAVLIAGAASAVQPDEILKEPAQEARARSLSAEIRCLVCQNQSIDDSEASLARDLRLLVREQIKAGRSDQDIRDFLVERYGAFVLLKPPVQDSTLLLWFGPLIVLFCGVIGLIIFFRRRGHAAPAGDGLSDAERARIETLLSERDTNEDRRA